MDVTVSPTTTRVPERDEPYPDAAADSYDGRKLVARLDNADEVPLADRLTQIYVQNKELRTPTARHPSSLNRQVQEMGAELKAARQRRDDVNKPKAPAVISKPSVTIEEVIEKLMGRGWTYRVCRSGNEYFKPGVGMDSNNAILNEDFFECESKLENYLKASGLWEEIALELQDDYVADQVLQKPSQAKRVRYTQ